MIDVNILKESIKCIRAEGKTVRGWADRNGFVYQTVIKVIHGYTGKRQIGMTLDIIDALKRDGYLKEEEAK